MNPAQLLAHFDRMTEAPDAIPRLRQFVLDLAVRGKLVEQDPNDEPASELLKRIQAAKVRLVKEGKVTKQPLPAVNAPNTPFPVPKRWAWLPLNEIGVVSGGMTPSKNRAEFWEGDINWFSPKDLKSDELIDSELKITATGVSETGLQLYPAGCLFMVARSGILKRTFPVSINRVEATANQDLKILKPFMGGLERYLQIMFRGMTDFILSALVKTGTTVQSLKYEEFQSQPFPVPPLAEQHRIVAKVDELMALCDRLETAQAERESRRDRLAAASLHHLNNGADVNAFREHARFHLHHLPRFTTRPEHIQQLRQTILNLAVRGHLVPRDSNDEPASELLKHIEQTRVRLYAERKIPKSKELHSLVGIELPFEVPSSWSWTTLGKLCYQISDGPHHSPTYVSRNVGVPFLSTRNIRVDRFDLSDIKYVSREDHERFCQRIRPEKGDILYTKGGTTGIARVNDLEFEFSVWVHVAVLRVAKEFLVPQYVALALNSPLCYEQSQRYTQGISNFDLGLTRMIKILIPLPPLAEQHRILVKVDELMALRDKLEAQLTTAQTDSRRLLEATLADALSEDGEILQEVLQT